MELDELFNTYFKDVYRYVLRLSNNEHLADEITSDTFFKAMRSIKDFRGDCDIRVWLCQIAKNSYYSFLKKQKNISNIDDIEFQNLEDSNSLIDEKIVKQEDTRQLQKVLHTLSDPYKEVFMWRVFAELNFKQIGQIFNKTDNWACVTYHRARAMIKNRLEELNNGK
ncbi:hypothetical protein P261_02382 [Lachnospiraceae bacterium TWA4]|nr:hypothetical protein P261_02382 [Lachnospiraceae bacterium TWA4]